MRTWVGLGCFLGLDRRDEFKWHRPRVEQRRLWARCAPIPWQSGLLDRRRFAWLLQQSKQGLTILVRHTVQRPLQIRAPLLETPEYPELGSDLSARHSVLRVEDDHRLDGVAPRKTGFAGLGEPPNGLLALKDVARHPERAHPTTRRRLAVAKEYVADFDPIKHADAVASLARGGGREARDAEVPQPGLCPRLKREDVSPVGHTLSGPILVANRRKRQPIPALPKTASAATVAGL